MLVHFFQPIGEGWSEALWADGVPTVAVIFPTVIAAAEVQRAPDWSPARRNRFVGSLSLARAVQTKQEKEMEYFRQVEIVKAVGLDPYSYSPERLIEIAIDLSRNAGIPEADEFAHPKAYAAREIAALMMT
jgi:hypothetical protein